MLNPIDISKSVVDFCGKATTATLSGVRNGLTASMDLASENLAKLTDKPMIKFADVQNAFKAAADKLNQAGEATSEGMASAIDTVSRAFEKAGSSLRIADEFTTRNLFENAKVGSVVGRSFDSVLKTNIEPSFRMNGADVSAAQIQEAFKKSGCKSAIVMIPGLFCDETIWTDPDDSLSDYFLSRKVFPIETRFHPGIPVFENGRNLLTLLDELHASGSMPLNVASYSNGGLIFRSCMYYAKLTNKPWISSIKKAAIISPPDGGSYIEKLGFWLAQALKAAPWFGVQTLGWIGNMRSDAMKDLSHGIIREQDREGIGHLKRYTTDLYFGELDDVDAYLIYSLISESNDPIKTWLGDGVCEKGSLEYLKDKVYLKKGSGEDRVHCIPGRSHFQILGSPELKEILSTLY